MTELTNLEPLAKRLKVDTGAPVSHSSSAKGSFSNIVVVCVYIYICTLSGFVLVSLVFFKTQQIKKKAQIPLKQRWIYSQNLEMMVYEV